MIEKIKSMLLILLILLSVVLTYRLWFGRPPLEEGTVPKYEYAYFTPPPEIAEIIQPAEIIFYHEGEMHVFGRGQKEHGRLWHKGRQLLQGRIDMQSAKSINEEDLSSLLETFSSKLVYNFIPSLPLDFIIRQSVFVEMSLEGLIFLWDEELVYVILQGNENLLLPLGRVESLREELIPEEKNPHVLLPPLLTLNIPSGEKNGDLSAENVEEEIIPAEEKELQQAPEEEYDFAPWQIEVPGTIYLAEGDLCAAELHLSKEEINSEQLVRACFFDLSMARRIEERDGALYFTNGEKGLRIYASGLVEYTVPRLEQISSKMSYSTALQNAAESQSLYGGWLPETYLYAVDIMRGGYNFVWRTIHEGLIFEGEGCGSEMIINEQGVAFYRRNLLIIGEEITERKSFCAYEKALDQVLMLRRDFFQNHKPVLLSLKPVYYVSPLSMEKAIPAWAVKFEGLGEIYLHWVTLEQLQPVN